MTVDPESKFDLLRPMLPDTAEINSSGNLMIGGCDSTELAADFGTPLFVYCEKTFRSLCRQYRAAFASQSIDTEIIYASKAFISGEICKIAEAEGLGLDIASGGELYLALRARFPAERLYFHGNNKSSDELTEAISAGVGRIVVDNFDELEAVSEIGQVKKRRVQILLRLTPGIKADTHRYLQTATIESKFGFPLVAGIAMSAVSKALELSHVDLRGFHTHIGSQIFNIQPYREAGRIITDFVAEVRAETGYHALAGAAGDDMKDNALELNMGGGLGIMYNVDDKPPTVEEFAAAVTEGVQEGVSRQGLGRIKLMVEPGRSVIGRAGVTIYRVGAIKEVPGHVPYVSIDGGMSDNMRPLLYGARYEAMLANRPSDAAKSPYSISGRHCETGDILIRKCKLPIPERGDLLLTPATGAYGYAMANNYNKALRPAVALVARGTPRLIIRRETYDDLGRLEIMGDRN